MVRSSTGSPTPELPRSERILTWPLACFLLIVLGTLALALGLRLQTPDAAAAAARLADGDDDGEERDILLQVLVKQGATTDVVRDRWAALVAAVALADRAAYDRLLAAFGGLPPAGNSLPSADRRNLWLGDDRIRNLTAAMWAEAEGDRVMAVRRWQQLAAECELAPNVVASALAADALARLR